METAHPTWKRALGESRARARSGSAPPGVGPSLPLPSCHGTGRSRTEGARGHPRVPLGRPVADECRSHPRRCVLAHRECEADARGDPGARPSCGVLRGGGHPAKPGRAGAPGARAAAQTIAPARRRPRSGSRDRAARRRCQESTAVRRASDRAGPRRSFRALLARANPRAGQRAGRARDRRVSPRPRARAGGLASQGLPGSGTRQLRTDGGGAQAAGRDLGQGNRRRRPVLHDGGHPTHRHQDRSGRERGRSHRDLPGSRCEALGGTRTGPARHRQSRRRASSDSQRNGGRLEWKCPDLRARGDDPSRARWSARPRSARF